MNEYGAAFQAELPSATLTPPLYSEESLGRLFPNARGCANGVAAPLIALPLMMSAVSGGVCSSMAGAAGRGCLAGRGGLPDDLAERLHRQRHDGRCAVNGHDDLAAHGHEAAHLDAKRPRAVVDVGDLECSVVGRQRRERLAVTDGADGRAGNAHAGEGDAAGQIGALCGSVRHDRRPQQSGDHRGREPVHLPGPIARAGGLPAKASATAGLFGVGRST